MFTIKIGAVTTYQSGFGKGKSYKCADPQRLAQNRKNKTKNDNSHKVQFQLSFLNDRYVRNVRKTLRQYDFQIQTAFVPSKNLTQCFKNEKKSFKHENCEICNKMPDKFNCQDRFLVYKFTCNLCKGFYIGQTCRPFKLRFNEHKRSIEQNNLSSALADHAQKIHSTKPMNISDFDLEILSRCYTPLQTRLTEARLISSHRPDLNRKHELASLKSGAPSIEPDSCCP